MKSSTTNCLRLIKVILLICSFEITKENHPKHLRALNWNDSQCKGTSKIAVPALWCNTGPSTVNAPQCSLQRKRVSKLRSPKGVGETRLFCREKKQDLKQRVQKQDPVGNLGHLRVGTSTAQANGWWPQRAREARAAHASAAPWGSDAPFSISRRLHPLGDARTAAFKAHPCHEAGSSKRQREQKPFCHIWQISASFLSGSPLLSLRRDQLTWTGSPHIQAPLPTQCLFTYCTLNSHWMNHPPLKSGLSSQISQALEKGQLLLNTTARCHHVCASPWDRGFWGLLLCWAPQGPLSRLEVLLSGLSWVDLLLFGLSLNSAMSQKSNHWK